VDTSLHARLELFLVAARDSQSIRYPGGLHIAKHRHLTPEEREVEARAALLLDSDPTEAIRWYRDRWGNVIDVDLAREMFPEYSAGAPARTRYTRAVSRPARALADLVWERMMEEARALEAPFDVLFTAGGPGSGKSFAIEHALPDLKQRVYVIRDSSLEDFGDSVRKMDEVVAAFGTPLVVYVHRPLQEAVVGVLNRAVDPNDGRIVTIEDLANKHYWARANIVTVRRRYAKRLGVVFLDNRRSGVRRVRRLPAASYNGVEEAEREARDVLEAERARRAAIDEPIPDHVYKALVRTNAPAEGGVLRGFDEGRPGPGSAGADRA
jgi:hypothetical protein